MGYKQELQVKQNESKELLKSLKKQRTRAKKEKQSSSHIRKLDLQIRDTEYQIERLNPSKYELYRLSNGVVVNLKILKNFLKKLKGNSFTALQETKEGLTLGYSTNGQHLNGKLQFYAMDPEFTQSLKSIPNFNEEEWL